jgi:hypothetical protein
MTFSQKAFSTGCRRSKFSASAPTIVFRRPSSASFGVRASGASMYATPRSARSARIRAVELGSLVEQSTTSLTGCREQAVSAGDNFLDLWRAGHAKEMMSLAATNARVARFDGAGCRQIGEISRLR